MKSLIVPTELHFPGRCTYRGSGCMKTLKARFREVGLLERAKQSPFGAFFRDDDLQFSGVLFHQLMLRRIDVESSRRKKEVHFLIGSTECRFGRDEFCLMTGLNYTEGPSDEEMAKNVSDDRLIREYFNGKHTISLKTLLEVFSSKCSVVEDIYKLGLCYFVEAGLYGSDIATNIRPNMLKFVDNLEFFFRYPWGKLSFNKLIVSCKKDMRHYVKNFNAKKVGQQKEARYSAYGYVPALQYWAYEAISVVGNDYGIHNGNQFPRMLNWSSKPQIQPKNSDFRHLFSNKTLCVFESLNPQAFEMDYYNSLAVDEPLLEGPDYAANNFDYFDDNEGGDKTAEIVMIKEAEMEVVRLESSDKKIEYRMNSSEGGDSDRVDRLEGLERSIVNIVNKLENGVSERLEKNAEGGINKRMDRAEKMLQDIVSKQDMMNKNQTTIITELKDQSDKLTKIENILADLPRTSDKGVERYMTSTVAGYTKVIEQRPCDPPKKSLQKFVPVNEPDEQQDLEECSMSQSSGNMRWTEAGNEWFKTLLNTPKECLIDVKLESDTVLLEKEITQPSETLTYLRSHEDVSDMYTDEATIWNIMKHENSAASIFCCLKHHQSLSVHTKDVVGVLATLGKVSDDNLSRLLSEYLGLDNMLSLVCMTCDGAKELVSYDKEGSINKSSGLYGLGTAIGLTLEGRFNLICLENIRPYDGKFVPNDPQKRLNFPSPRLSNGETPPGFIGFAVNMFHIDDAHLFYLTTDGNGLRETLFYNLFSRLQVYGTRTEMLQALTCIHDGAISLDGGMVKSNGVYVHGNREEINVKFPVTSGVSYEACVEVEKEMKELKRKQERMLEDMQREETMLAYAKYNYEVKKQKLLGIMEQNLT